MSSSNYTPTIIFHGTLDPIVPLYHSQWFSSKLEELGLAHEYYEYEGESHGLNEANRKDCIEKTINFFKVNM